MVDPFSKKGGLTLFWLLARWPDKAGDAFSINQAAREVGSEIPAC